jgi:uncharacterized protein YndB with AHSA1/START domain
MSDPSRTLRLHRVFRAPPERAFRAFIDPDALLKWIPPHGFVGKIHEFDAREGGGYRMSFKNFGTGSSHSFGARFVEISPPQRLRYVDRFDDASLPGEMQVTVEFRPAACGVEIRIEQAGIPAPIPLEFCYLGWQESLNLLAHVIEPEIPDGA